MPTNVWGRACSRPGVLNSFLACLAFLLPISAVHASSSIVIGEVNWAGSSHSNADEWVELWNTTPEEQSLAHWTLEGAGSHTITLSETATIPAYGTLILSNYDETNPKSTLNTPTPLVTTDVALSNETIHLVLKDPQGNVIDEAGDGTRPPAGMTRPFTSMLRSDPLAATWMHSTSSYGLDADVSDLGTPGLCDGCIRTPPMVTESPPQEPLAATYASSTPPLIPALPTPEEETTSTVPLIEEPQLIPDEPVLTDTTSTELEVIPEPIDPEPSSSSTIALPTDEVSSSTTTIEPIPEIETSCEWRLKTLLPAPSDGQERVTISGCDEIDNLMGLVLRDTQGIILTVTSSTPYLLTSEGDWQLTLPSQRLNNSGDSVLLYAIDGRLIDSVSYPSMQHDEHYSRLANGTWWIPERTPPPSAAVTATPSTFPLSSDATSPPVPTITPPTATSTTVVTPKKQSTTSTTTRVSTSSTKAIALPKKVTSMSWAEYTTSKIRSNATSSKAAVAKPKTVSTTTKTTVKKTTSSMTTSSSSPRVLLYGTVGTPANLIAKRRFVVLNADGTGLLVYGSTSQPSPALGSSISVYGTLITNDDGTHLEMRAHDRWELSESPFPSPKITAVDLLSVEPSQAWSLTEFTGRIISRGTTSVRIETNEMELTIALPTILGYRAQRLQVGDLIRVQGVLDLRGAIPQLYPRTPTEITIVEAKASIAATSIATKQTNLPPWAPMSAATATIAGGYGFMRWRAWYKQKQLERQLTLAIDQLPS